jgi:hypothetical protein
MRLSSIPQECIHIQDGNPSRMGLTHKCQKCHPHCPIQFPWGEYAVWTAGRADEDLIDKWACIVRWDDSR